MGTRNSISLPITAALLPPYRSNRQHSNRGTQAGLVSILDETLKIGEGVEGAARNNRRNSQDRQD